MRRPSTQPLGKLFNVLDSYFPTGQRTSLQSNVCDGILQVNLFREHMFANLLHSDVPEQFNTTSQQEGRESMKYTTFRTDSTLELPSAIAEFWANQEYYLNAVCSGPHIQTTMEALYEFSDKGSKETVTRRLGHTGPTIVGGRETWDQLFTDEGEKGTTKEMRDTFQFFQSRFRLRDDISFTQKLALKPAVDLTPTEHALLVQEFGAINPLVEYLEKRRASGFFQCGPKAAKALKSKKKKAAAAKKSTKQQTIDQMFKSKTAAPAESDSDDDDPFGGSLPPLTDDEEDENPRDEVGTAGTWRVGYPKFSKAAMKKEVKLRKEARDELKGKKYTAVDFTKLVQRKRAAKRREERLKQAKKAAKVAEKKVKKRRGKATMKDVDVSMPFAFKSERLNNLGGDEEGRVRLQHRATEILGIKRRAKRGSKKGSKK
ncbi:hypothetical protein R3P38DRAFT_2800930 [Favolaschia claudopus]|uniref:Uncharacterized protein n=1 Tax=Favolaschia claudopus TaxID=2862362 RepID=A0AAV9ZWS8_9AGAR